MRFARSSSFLASSISPVEVYVAKDGVLRYRAEIVRVSSVDGEEGVYGYPILDGTTGDVLPRGQNVVVLPVASLGLGVITMAEDALQGSSGPM